MAHDPLEWIVEEWWNDEELHEFIDRRNTIVAYIEAAEQLASVAAKIATDDFWLQDALDTYNKRAVLVRTA